MFPSMSDSREARIARFGFSEDVRNKILRARRCFILGLGPSINKISPSAFERELLIGVNRVMRTSFTPDIVCVSDPMRLDVNNLHKIKNLVTCNHIFEKYKDKIASAGKLRSYHNINVHFPLSKTWDFVDSLDPRLETIYWGGAVITDLAIPLSVYFGIEEIYILGLDDVSRSYPVSHAYGSDDVEGAPESSLVNHLQGRMGYLAAQEGVKIFNASVGGGAFTFKRVALDKILDGAIKRNFDIDISNKYIAFDGNVLCAHPSVKDGIWRFKGEANRVMRHRHNILHLDKDIDEDMQLKLDSDFIVEPSFFRNNWISLRSSNLPRSYVTSTGPAQEFRLRPISSAFSPFFSSFEVFDSKTDAYERAEFDRLLKTVDMQFKSLGRLLASR
uniref:DUF115 domain-containing protein n=1 Tax=Candidatus Kentrum sp. DK TaxID=2126562 RepID=A0A450T2F5_9GAMM|nr:MAG: hypothetical protein BECKDK2373B_GA0170837_10935 [Candidatus Kentron sp. DK]